jgi:hypothetical protein
MASVGKRYSVKVESQMRAYYESLNEKDRRRYAGIEATKLGHGGIGDIAGNSGVQPAYH